METHTNWTHRAIAIVYTTINDYGITLTAEPFPLVEAARSFKYLVDKWFGIIISIPSLLLCSFQNEQHFSKSTDLTPQKRSLGKGDPSIICVNVATTNSRLSNYSCFIFQIVLTSISSAVDGLLWDTARKEINTDGTCWPTAPKLAMDVK